MQQMQGNIYAHINGLMDQLKRQMHEYNSGKKNYGLEIEQIMKRCARNENMIIEMQ